MNYTFHPIESRIVDFLLFPLGYDYSKQRSEEVQRDETPEYDPPGLHEEWLSIEQSLKPFEERIRSFYFDTYSFPELLLKTYPPFSFSTADTYFQALSRLDRSMILGAIGSKIGADIAEADKASLPPIDSASLADQLRLLDFIPVSDQEKWRLQSLLRFPESSLAEWISLLQDLEPVFAAYYADKQDAVLALGRRIAEELERSSGEAFGRMTKGLIHSFSELPRDILVSCMEPVSIQIHATSTIPHVYWGLRVEEILNHVYEKKESKQKDRVQIFKNLGDPTRYEVLKCIAEGVETAKQIATRLHVSQPTISYHINNLLYSKIVYLDRVNGRYVYSVDVERLREVCAELIEDLRPSAVAGEGVAQ
jgi:DNA-binding transcriptional ArsR family regulator